MNEILPINDTTYEVTLPGDDKVEIGKREAVDFKPHIKLNRWGGECFIRVGLPTAEKITPVVKAGKVKWQGQKMEAHFYPLEPKVVTAKDGSGRDRHFAQNELGGFEFEIVLKEKPAINQIVFDIQAQGLRFSYQPPLTQQEIERGAIRPDNVVGSYAVYHATRGNIHRGAEDAEKYKTGKAFHIYRPHLVDALGKEAWAGLNISDSVLTITLPQGFLDEAMYPVTIDPDFGYTAIGGSSRTIAEQAFIPLGIRRGSAWTMPAPGGTANYIRAYIGDAGFPSSPTDCKVFINQKDSGGAGTHGQIAGPVENLACATAVHWEEFTLAGEVLTSGVVYILNIIGDSNDLGMGETYSLFLDTNGAVASYEDGNVYCSEESPWVRDPEGTTLDYSIYCNYTAAAVGWTGKISGVTNPAKVMGVAVANIAKVKGVA